MDEIKDALKDIFGEKEVEEIFNNDDLIKLIRNDRGANADITKKIFYKYCDSNFSPKEKFNGDVIMDMILKISTLMHMHRFFENKVERGIVIANTVTYLVDMFIINKVVRNFKQADRIFITATISFILYNGWEYFTELGNEIFDNEFKPRTDQKINYGSLIDSMRDDND